MNHTFYRATLIRSSITVLAACLAIAPALAKDATAKPAAAKPAAAVTVNGKAISANRAEALVAAQTAQGQPDSEDLRNMVREELVRREVVAQEAQKKGLDKKAIIQGQMELARQGVLISAYISDFIKAHPISDEVIRKEYESIKAQLGNKEYKARHILVEKEADANDIIVKLKKGEKFEELAKQSKDPGSKDRGGDLGWTPPSSFVKPFSEAMVKLEKGKYTETPVKTDHGYHVILLDDTRELKLPQFDEVKPQLTQRLQQQMVEKHIVEIRNKAKVE